jgi:hypothetical protein
MAGMEDCGDNTDAGDKSVASIVALPANGREEFVVPFVKLEGAAEGGPLGLELGSEVIPAELMAVGCIDGRVDATPIGLALGRAVVAAALGAKVLESPVM